MILAIVASMYASYMIGDINGMRWTAKLYGKTALPPPRVLTPLWIPVLLGLAFFLWAGVTS